MGVIASSPTDIQPVLDAVAESAARLCDAMTLSICAFDGDVYRVGGPLWADARLSGPDESHPSAVDRSLAERFSIGRRSTSRTWRQNRTTSFPNPKLPEARAGTRTILATPLLREGYRYWCD